MVQERLRRLNCLALKSVSEPAAETSAPLHLGNSERGRTSRGYVSEGIDEPQIDRLLLVEDLQRRGNCLFLFLWRRGRGCH